MTTRGRAAGYPLALLPIVFWGVSFVAVKVALRSLSPLGLVTGRAFLGCGVMAALFAFRRTRRDDAALPGDGARILVLAVLGVVLQGWIQAHALTMTSAIHSGWLISLIPLFTALLSAAFLRERFPPLKIIGVAVGLAGALLVVRAGAPSGRLDAPATRGDLLILLSALNWSIYTLVGRSLFVRRDPLTVTAKSLVWGTAILVGAYLVSGNWPEIRGIEPAGFWSLAFLGIACTGIAYVAWAGALARFEPGTLTSLQYLQPLVTLLAASYWLHEPFGPEVLAGAALVLLGVFLVQRVAVLRPGPPRSVG